MTTRVNVSVVVPVYAGEPYLEALASSVESLRQSWEQDAGPLALNELILVDDAAVDGSPSLIDDLARDKFWIVALHLSRNYGQHAATIAGILHSSGDWVVTLDEDLQHPPERISELLERSVSTGSDVVYARSNSGTVHGTVWRDFSSRNFKLLMEWLTGNPTLRLVNSFRLIRGPIARATASVCSHNTYLDIALFWFTQRIDAVEMELRDERFMRNKKSGYNLRRLVAHAQRMLFSSQLRFLSLGMWIGAGLFLISFLSGFYFLVVQIASPEKIPVQGWTSLFLIICMSSGILAVMLGLCLQYLSTLVLKAHGRPTFFTVDRGSDAPIAAWFAQRRLERAERNPT